jgi:hypothetical protein
MFWRRVVENTDQAIAKANNNEVKVYIPFPVFMIEKKKNPRMDD